MDFNDPTLDERLREKGLRPTRARRLIMSYLAGRTDHPDAEAIRQGLFEAGERLGPATLYQNLSRLASAALVGRLAGPDGVMRFDATVAPHPHAVCLRCGCIVDVQVPAERLQGLTPMCPHTRKRLTGWKLQTVTVGFSGVCPSCATKSA